MSWMDILKILLERLLSWPVITLGTFLVFRKPLTALLNRVHTLKAGKDGFSLDASIAAVATQSETKIEIGLKPEAERRLKVVKNIAISPSIQQREEWIRTDLQNMNLTTAGQETVDLLIHHLAVQQAVASAERIYRTIFGSQIAVLRILNSRGTATSGDLEEIYAAARSRFPTLYARYPFQQWLGYFLSQGLLSATGNEQFTLTIDGKEFLKWMTDVAVTEEKPF